jgi:hypothetical protein
MVPSFETLLAFARSVEGQVLHTLKRAKPFYVSVEAEALRFTPAESERRRSARTEPVKKVLQRLKETGSFEPSEYKEFSFNASYVLALVREWQSRQTS